MGRRKIKIVAIENKRVRNLTFNARKNGLVKKLIELSLMCDAEIGMVINFDSKPYVYSSKDFLEFFLRYLDSKSVAEDWNNVDHHYLSQTSINSIKEGYADRGTVVEENEELRTKIVKMIVKREEAAASAETDGAEVANDDEVAEYYNFYNESKRGISELAMPSSVRESNSSPEENSVVDQSEDNTGIPRTNSSSEHKNGEFGPLNDNFFANDDSDNTYVDDYPYQVDLSDLFQYDAADVGSLNLSIEIPTEESIFAPQGAFLPPTYNNVANGAFLLDREEYILEPVSPPTKKTRNDSIEDK